ncbi:hypothetical protein NPIL_221341 [Nephila pilipes]|uniref:Uncharacterized protein n=1 Tax=Nephila pilipes TaxID=299642 RepID=A0A8X6R092_NEPPI|nr:hypothetical protein NPIL_221341 [Nephila pilipes]
MWTKHSSLWTKHSRAPSVSGSGDRLSVDPFRNAKPLISVEGILKGRTGQDFFPGGWSHFLDVFYVFSAVLCFLFAKPKYVLKEFEY